MTVPACQTLSDRLYAGNTVPFAAPVAACTSRAATGMPRGDAGTSGTVGQRHWDLDPVVLHGDREPVGKSLFRQVSAAAETQS
jgi:hypothetical protein